MKQCIQLKQQTLEVLMLKYNEDSFDFTLCFYRSW